jgi:hypothetical protein
LAERLVRNQKVGSSILPSSTYQISLLWQLLPVFYPQNISYFNLL